MRGSRTRCCWCLVLHALAACSSSVAGSPWNVGDIFATAYGRVHVIDGRKLQVKQTINLFARNGLPLCPGKISGGEFDSTGTILHLACEGASKVVSLDATSMRQHKVLGNFTTARLPGSLAVGKTGTIYVSHSSGPPGSVSSYSPKTGNLLEQFQAGSDKITALKLSAAGDKLLTTSGGPKLHQYSIVGREPVATTMVVAAAAGAAKGGQRGGSRCYGLDVPKDGSVLIACKSCVFHVSPSGAPSGSKFCPAGNSTGAALKHIALDPTNKFFYVADGNSNVVHKVSLKDWSSTANFTVPGARKIHGLVVLRRIDEVAFQEGRKRSEAEWWQAVKRVPAPQQQAANKTLTPSGAQKPAPAKPNPTTAPPRSPALPVAAKPLPAAALPVAAKPLPADEQPSRDDTAVPAQPGTGSPAAKQTEPAAGKQTEPGAGKQTGVPAQSPSGAAKPVLSAAPAAGTAPAASDKPAAAAGSTPATPPAQGGKPSGGSGSSRKLQQVVPLTGSS